MMMVGVADGDADVGLGSGSYDDGELDGVSPEPDGAAVTAGLGNHVMDATGEPVEEGTASVGKAVGGADGTPFDVGAAVGDPFAVSGEEDGEKLPIGSGLTVVRCLFFFLPNAASTFEATTVPRSLIPSWILSFVEAAAVTPVTAVVVSAAAAAGRAAAGVGMAAAGPPPVSTTLELGGRCGRGGWNNVSVDGFANWWGLNIGTRSVNPAPRACAASPTTQASVIATSSGLLAAWRPEPVPGAAVGLILPEEFDTLCEKRTP